MSAVHDAENKPDGFTRSVYPILLCIARHHLPEAYAQDAVQEAITRFWAGGHQQQAQEKRSPYLIGILKNVIKEMLRKSYPFRQELPELPDQTQTQEEVIVQDEEQKIVRHCFAKLSAKCQKLLILNLIEGRSFNELERLLNQSHSTLHRWCRKNLKHFSAELKKYEII